MQHGSLEKIRIFTEPRCSGVDYSVVKSFVQDCVQHIPVEIHGPLLESACGETDDGSVLDSLADSLARAKVRRTNAPATGEVRVLPGEIDYERRRLVDRQSTVFGILYDAYLLSDIYRNLLGPRDSVYEVLNIVVTNQLIGTWDGSDYRYHARSVLLGSPAVLSISGLVEAPAKATGYYLARRGAEAMGLGEEEKLALAQSFADDCLGHEDARLTEVAKGYVMQAITYRISGEAFCSDPDCRLYNAHWQSELLRAQLGASDDFCRRHRELLKRM